MKRLLLASALSVVAASAQAVTTSYTDVSNYAIATNNQIGFISEDFEDVPSSDDGVPTITFDWGTISEIGGGALNYVYVHEYSNMPGAQPAADGTDNALWYEDNGASLLEIVFNTEITALSFYVSSSDSSDIAVTLSTGDVVTAASESSDPTFFGLTSDTAFSSFTLGAPGSPNVGIDLMKFGNLAAVPLPASGVLLLAGLGALGLRRRKRA